MHSVGRKDENLLQPLKVSCFARRFAVAIIFDDLLRSFHMNDLANLSMIRLLGSWPF